MDDDLRSAGLIPLQEPYTSYGYSPTGLNSTTTSVLSTTGDNAFVDWVLVQARSGNSSSQIVSSKTALIQRDGDIINPDGSTLTLSVPPSINNIYIALIHRNHFGVRTQNSYAASDTISVDFSNGTTPVYGIDPMMNVDGKKALYAGDANDDGQINVIDKNNFWRVQNANPYNYLDSNSDFNLDGMVNSVYVNLRWRPNNTKFEQLD